MGLRTKFNITMGICMLVGFLGSGLIAHNLLQSNAREEVLESASIMMESAMAVRSYTVQEIKPLLAIQQRRQFISQTVPAYAAGRYIANFQEKHPEYSYKEATLNPTNPADRATDWEADVISWFKNHSGESELIGERETPTGRMLYVSRPIQIKDENCLACHGTPAEAPQTLIDTYGPANGFGWELNEIVGAQIVTVPMDIPLTRAQNTFVTFMIALVVLFLLVFALINILLHRVVIKPMALISSRANDVSMGELNVSELEVKGNDEIADLSRSFNRMHRSLTNAVKMLDEMEDEDEFKAAS